MQETQGLVLSQKIPRRRKRQLTPVFLPGGTAGQSPVELSRVIKEIGQDAE